MLINQEIIKTGVKVFELIIVVLFIIYSYLTIREVDLMNRTLVTSFARFVKIASLVQLSAGILVLLIIATR